MKGEFKKDVLNVLSLESMFMSGSKSVNSELNSYNFTVWILYFNETWSIISSIDPVPKTKDLAVLNSESTLRVAAT
jgi:hypothetical protein